MFLRFLGGYAGSILRVNLSSEKILKVPLSKELAAKYIGGTGFCVKTIYDETRPETEPLGAENRLIMATGPITGTYWPASSRWNVAAKSPLTGIWGESNAGGNFASELKFAGYNAIIFRGKAKKPVYLWIDDDTVKVRDASHLWGKTVSETDEIIKSDLNDKEIQVVSIGQGGENLVLFAGILDPLSRAAARSGLGAVMGSKKLKAVAVRGSNGIKPANPKAFSQLFERHRKQIIGDPWLGEIWTKYGTTVLVEAMNEIARFPTKNFQTGVFPMAPKISGDVLVNRYKVRDRACLSCPLACKNYLRIGSGPYAGSSGICPDYETINSFGGRCWNDDIELIMRAHWLCDEYGLDSISTGSIIAFAMELWDRGIITKKDTGELDFTWGNKETIEKMVHMIAKREDFGNLLADGVVKAAEKIGRGTMKYAMQVKGLDIAAQDGRAQKSMAIAHATSARGADHLRHCTFYDEIGRGEAIKERWGEQYLPEMEDRLEIKYKGIMAKDCEDYTALIDSLGICTSTMQLLWFNDLAELYTAVVGIKVDSIGIQRIAERIVDQRRAYNIRLGLSRKEDTLPKRFLKDPAPAGPCKGEVVNLKPMLDDYYRHRGYDIKTGLIPRARLEKLNLKYVADELEKMGKLPEEEIKGE